MSVRRVSDLPSLQDPDNEKLSNSFLEISFLQDDSQRTGQRYVSNKLLVSKLVEQASRLGLNSPQISGDFYANSPLVTQNSHRCELNFGSLDIMGDTSFRNSVSANEISCGSMYVSDRNSPTEDSVINYSQISGFVQEKIDDAIERMKGQMNPVPFLAVVFSDHQITDKNWLSGGSVVLMAEHTSLCAWLQTEENQKNLPTDGDYKYTISRDNGGSITSITLPSTDRYFRCTSDPLSVATILSSSLPNLSGDIGQFVKNNNTTTTGLFKRSSSKLPGPKQDSAKQSYKVNLNAKRYSGVYGRYSNDTSLSAAVVPETVLMIPYYYVGGGSEQ